MSTWWGEKYSLVSNEEITGLHLTPQTIKRRGQATIVDWADGMQTKIVCPADVEDMGLYTCFCIALAKKIYGNNSALKAAIRRADEDTQLTEAAAEKETKKQAHEERMRQQLNRANTRIARLARRKLKRELLGEMAVNALVEEEKTDDEV